MNKPAILSCFLGDTLSLQISLHDDSGAPFENNSWNIDTVQLLIPSLDAAIDGSIAANRVAVLIPGDTFQTPADYPFYVQIISSTSSCLFTVCTGVIKALPLPE